MRAILIALMIVCSATQAQAYVHKAKPFAPSLSRPKQQHLIKNKIKATPKKKTAQRLKPPKPKKVTPKSVQHKTAPKIALQEPAMTIVIDPGHGGTDPGAQGSNGLLEKHVTLAVSLKLAKELKHRYPHWKIVLTRSHDHTLSLPARTQIANRAQADLFLSIHANSHENMHAKGIETYYLDVTEDAYARRLANRENGGHTENRHDVQFILADLSTKVFTAQSVRLSQIIQRTLVTTLQKQWRGVNDLGVKSALFHVLLEAQMPAVLVEMAFISNPTEEDRLKSSSYQLAVANSLANGVANFMNQRQAKK